MLFRATLKINTCCRIPLTGLNLLGGGGGGGAVPPPPPPPPPPPHSRTHPTQTNPDRTQKRHRATKTSPTRKTKRKEGRREGGEGGGEGRGRGRGENKKNIEQKRVNRGTQKRIENGKT